MGKTRRGIRVEQGGEYEKNKEENRGGIRRGIGVKQGG